jgi:hypothetical protein
VKNNKKKNKTKKNNNNTTTRQRVCVWKRPVKQGDGHDRKPVAHAA